LGGHFNIITSLYEKKGGIQRLDANSGAFSHLIHSLKLVDMETSNGLFTWNKGRGGSNLVGWTSFSFLKVF
jgi:hypothetical protein